MDAVSKKTFPVINPTNGQVIAEVAEADKVCITCSYKNYFRNMNLFILGGC